MPILCLLSLLGLGPSTDAQAEPYAVIGVDEVERRLDERDFRVFDANGPKVYATAHVPGAVRLDFDAVTADTLPASPDATLVFYCKNKL